MDNKVFNSISFKDFIKSPLAYILFMTLIAIGYLYITFEKKRDSESKRLIEDLKNCEREIERRNKILEDIVFEKNRQ